MLSPQLSTFEITGEIRTKIQDKILNALFQNIVGHPPRKLPGKDFRALQ